ncbi:MAG: DUF3990 domain-containing protein [Candidatus Riflebacteria bacterium]|nr:DUF3990 domain-containing protein [Candidatus Riflebacteria bacterium]
MLVYHGSICEIKLPEVSYSKKYLDFGRGVYLTSLKKQAERWALRKAERVGSGIPTVNVYKMNEDCSGLKVLEFENENELWLDFICACRRGGEEYKKYDLIFGPVADDDVFKTINMYYRGFWDKERTLKEIKYAESTNQFCLTNQETVQRLLKFTDSYLLK